jgi:uncharacterized protein YfaS (alpha-2-macroglobulin family)
MLRSWRLRAVGSFLLLAVAAVWLTAADKPNQQELRQKALKAQGDGNWKDAYDDLRKLALDPTDDPAKVSQDLNNAVQCLQQLGRVDEIDEFREGVITAHAKNWRLLETAATSYTNVQHDGWIVAGKFYRGYKHGNKGGRYVGSFQRDRTRSLQLMQQALEMTGNETDKQALSKFHLHFAEMLLGAGGYYEPWRLQYLTDLKQLPDYDQGGWWGGHSDRGAPVDAKGEPVYHHVPKSYKNAESDGERWRWMLTQAVEFDPNVVNEVDSLFAGFMQGQLGEQTMAQFGFRRRADDGKENTSGTYALHTLSDEETIARLATGIKRIKVPDEFNWIKIYERIAGRGKSAWGEKARDQLAGIYENRRQYVKAVTAWNKAIEEYGPGHEGFRQKRFEQIVGNWGRFEQVQEFAAGKKATVDFRFRNGDSVSFEAFAIKVPKLLEDVKAFLKSNPPQGAAWEQANIGDIGWRLVEKQQTQYLGDKVASWDLKLKPRSEHVDDRVTVTTPLEKPGAYLLTAKMKDGNTSRIIIWINDSAIVKKPLENKTFYFVADAASGKPIPKANAEFFGWKWVQIKPNTNQYRVETAEFTETTDADGQVMLDANLLKPDYQWLVTARKSKDGPGGADRFAYYGFSGVWYNRIYDPEYNQIKAFAVTDRPVYRPDQTVQFKFWVRHAKYDQPDTSDFAGKTFKLQIHNPKGEKVHEQVYAADEYGGFAGSFPLAKGATLGQYNIAIVHDPSRPWIAQGGGSFRVEEYKKPEFEVQVEAPKEAVSLGEQVTATVQAKYYFGAPVTNAHVKVKVLRNSYSSNWYPRGRWDWFYGAGYWWFASDYEWYPGFNEWVGCKRPIPIWWRGWRNEQPEVVLEIDAPIGADGTVKVPIDTKPAKELHGDEDHEYDITAEVVDESRRTIVGTGKVLVSRKPFQVFSWVDRGHYRVGDTVKASFKAQTLDQKPVEGKGELTLYKISYNDKNEPVEKVAQTWKVDTDVEGTAHQQLKASEAGQYRLAYKVTDAKKHTIEGAYVFVIRGEGVDGRDFRFNAVELTTDQREYAPGDKVRLLVNTNQADSTVLLFVRPTNGIYLAPKVLRLKGKSVEDEIAVVQRDMPNFFVEALTVSNGRVHSETREVVVPPEKRVLTVDVLPSQKEYKPGQKATVKVKLTDYFGKPFVGSTVLTMYDRSVEYISGGSNVPEIREFYWKWRRHHSPQSEANVGRFFNNILRSREIGMSNLGIFGEQVIEELHQLQGANAAPGGPGGGGFGGGPRGAAPAPAEAPGMAFAAGDAKKADGAGMDRAEKGANEQQFRRQAGEQQGQQQQPPPGVEPTVRKNFADTAYWTASLQTDKDGIAEVSLTMPENLTGWKVKVWAMGPGTKVGQGEAEVTTKKDLLVRLQAPRFFVQKDEVVLSANVHNYLKTEKDVTVSLEIPGKVLVPADKLTQVVKIAAGGEKRVDWRVRVQYEGEAVVRMKAVSDEESDAMEMRFPSFVHGMLKTDSFSGVVRTSQESASVDLTVPAERRINESRLEVRYSPTLAGAMVDALPYMVDYPYGCTEQTLNRFLPTVITQKILLGMKLDLKEIEKKRTNLNAQEIGDAQERAKGWKRFPRNPVFSTDEVHEITNANVQALAAMQVSDGGWGWFSGFGEHSWPHTTAVVVHGLQIARDNDVKLPPGMLERGIEWLKNYQNEQVQRIKNAPTKTFPWKEYADNLDAFVYMVLVDGGVANTDMDAFLYRDRTHLAVYAKAMYGLALHKQQQAEKLAMILKNVEQFVVNDNENQTTYLRLPGDNYWWYWYGSEIEADAYYLKLLSRTSPKDEKAAGLVKYLLNNRKHATYWNSTRDTAVCIEAMAEYLKASGEDKPDMTVEIWLDGKKQKEEKIDAGNLFTFDNQFVLFGDAVETGKHTLEVKRKGTGPVYFNAYLTNFTLEDFITKAGLEVKVNRKYYKLNRVDKSVKVEGSRGQAADQKVEKYERQELPTGATLKSGDLVEVELEIDSKNDYEYLLFEDMKAAGFETVLVRSGYNPNDLGAFMELRDDRVCFFVRALPRGKHSVSYRLRAEIPGQFSALPTRASAMYAPELKGNSDEIKLKIKD